MDEISKCDEDQFECVEGVCNKVSLNCKDSCIAESWVFDGEIDCTGKSLSEALIFASTNPQHDDRLFIELQVQYMKIPSSNLGRRRRNCF